MALETRNRVQSIPLTSVRVVNPRARNVRQHREIVDSIAAVGLKRPITVCRRTGPDGEETFDLVCGQGRLEAVRLLGHSNTPSFVVDEDEHECLVMGLVENVARRNHSAPELLREVASLSAAGYPDEVVAKKVGLSVSYLRSLMSLLSQGEERLLAAVDAHAIPIGLALLIARSNDAETQRALADAYADGSLKGKQLLVVRRLIRRRATPEKPLTRPGGASPETQKLTPERLRQMYIRESEKQCIAAKRAEVVHRRLTFLIGMLRDLLSNPDFDLLLKSEGLTSIPRAIEQRIYGEASL